MKVRFGTCSDCFMIKLIIILRLCALWQLFLLVPFLTGGYIMGEKSVICFSFIQWLRLDRQIFLPYWIVSQLLANGHQIHGKTCEFDVWRFRYFSTRVSLIFLLIFKSFSTVLLFYFSICVIVWNVFFLEEFFLNSIVLAKRVQVPPYYFISR